jgi:hypothetical protein
VHQLAGTDQRDAHLLMSSVRPKDGEGARRERTAVELTRSGLPRASGWRSCTVVSARLRPRSPEAALAVDDGSVEAHAAYGVLPHARTSEEAEAVQGGGAVAKAESHIRLRASTYRQAHEMPNGRWPGRSPRAEEPLPTLRCRGQSPRRARRRGNLRSARVDLAPLARSGCWRSSPRCGHVRRGAGRRDPSGTPGPAGLV